MANFSKDDAKKVFEEKMNDYKEEDAQKVFSNWDAIYDKLKSNAIFGKLLDDAIDLYNMLKDYYNDKYTEVPVGTIGAIVVALLYIFSPIDVIPDFIPFAGLIDDALVLTICLEFVGSDLEKYRKWRKAMQKNNEEI